jgi:LacI family transcriptional regulator
MGGRLPFTHMKTARTVHRVKRRVLLLLGIYYPQHHAGIARYAREAGWGLNIFGQGGSPPAWWRGDGMITLITHPKDHEIFKLFPPRPMVDLSLGWIANSMPPALRKSGRGRPRVLADDEAIGRLAAEHFLERGFKHVAFFNFGNYWMEADRIPAFRATLEAGGARYHEIPYHRHFSLQTPHAATRHAAAHRWLTQAIRDLPKPVGIFAAADGIADMVVQACDEARAGVPEEVAVLGCNNETLLCDCAPVSMSSVDPDLEQQGYVAAQLLDRLMDGRPPPREPIRIPPRGVVTRQSTNILAVPHVPTARALRFIWEHYRERIKTPDVAAVAGLSRRGLEYAFRQHLHRSINAELNRCRVEHARSLLLKGGLKAHEVAEQSGFSDATDFSRVFFRATGLRPSRYRHAHSTSS